LLDHPRIVCPQRLTALPVRTNSSIAAQSAQQSANKDLSDSGVSFPRSIRSSYK
jgi:hypothetical protein